MKCVTFDGLGEYLFYDVRKNPDGSDRPHPLNDPRHARANILITESNFGCGSSREHAPQALYRWGIRALIAESYAEIFFGNCTTLGIPCVTATRDDAQMLARLVEETPELPVIVDVERSRVFYGLDGAKNFPVHLPDGAREVLINGKVGPDRRPPRRRSRHRHHRRRARVHEPVTPRRLGHLGTRHLPSRATRGPHFSGSAAR